MASPQLRFALSPFQNAFFHELADVLVHELERGGCAASVIDPSTHEPEPDDVFVLLPPHEYVALEGTGWLREPHLMARTIGLTAEQPHQQHFADNADIVRRAGAAFDFSEHAVQAYRALGVTVRHLRFGYTRRWDRFRPGPAAAGPPDVVFLGNASPRRQRLLARSAWALAPHRTHLVVSDNLTPNRESGAGFVAGESKRELLSRSRLMLNLHQTDEAYFEWLRFIEAFHCGTPVLSEPSIDSMSHEPGVHFLSAAPDALPHVLERVLRDDARLREVREAAYAKLHEQPLSAALDALVGAAATLLAHPPASHLPPRIRQQPLPHPDRTPLELDLTSDESVIRQSLREVRLELHTLRREIATLRHELEHPESLAATPAAVTIEVTTPAARTADVEVSVIMALYNHAEFVVSALDSVANSDADVAVEIVVVDDGSTDASCDVVRRWMLAHPEVPARLVAHRVNRGLPYARNTALDVARGRYVFVLDADNEVYPHCLHQLRDALDADEGAWFAYGLLEVFDAHGPFALIDIWPWQPWRLARGNYIDAMAMVRTERLRQLGGYTTDRRLYGWEDYDVWCRVAEQGGRGTQVPSIVARYRSSATSMVALSNVSHVPAFTALKERCPLLMSGRLDGEQP
jgi:hypothetical protein